MVFLDYLLEAKQALDNIVGIISSGNKPLPNPFVVTEENYRDYLGCPMIFKSRFSTDSLFGISVGQIAKVILEEEMWYDESDVYIIDDSWRKHFFYISFEVIDRHNLFFTQVNGNPVICTQSIYQLYQK